MEFSLTFSDDDQRGFDRFGGYAQVAGTLFIGLADLWRDPNRRLAHDRGANTVVLRARRAADEEVASRESRGSHSS